MLIRQHDYYTGVPWAGHNKRPLENLQFYHTPQYHRCRKYWWSMQLQELSTIAVAREFNVNFYHKPSPKEFQRIWQYIQPASQQQTTCNHTSHIQTSTSNVFTFKLLHLQFLHKLSETVSGKLVCMLVILIVTDLSGKMLTFDGVWHFGEVFSLRMNPGFHCIGQMADSVYGIVWLSGLLMSTLWIEWPMVAVVIWYGQAYVMNNKTGAFYWCHF